MLGWGIPFAKEEKKEEEEKELKKKERGEVSEGIHVDTLDVLDFCRCFVSFRLQKSQVCIVELIFFELLLTC